MISIKFNKLTSLNCCNGNLTPEWETGNWRSHGRRWHHGGVHRQDLLARQALRHDRAASQQVQLQSRTKGFHLLEHLVWLSFDFGFSTFCKTQFCLFGTGWHIKLIQTLRWHQNKSSLLVGDPCTKMQLLFCCQWEVWINVMCHPVYGRNG